jgi:hypothetical protein
LISVGSKNNEFYHVEKKRNSVYDEFKDKLIEDKIERGERRKKRRRKRKMNESPGKESRISIKTHNSIEKLDEKR